LIPPDCTALRAWTYGHSQVREDFELNSRSGRLRLFPDLLGFRPVAAERAIEWDRLFDVPGRPPAQRAKLIDGTLVPSLIALPHAVTGEVEVEAYRSLAATSSADTRTASPPGRASRVRWARRRSALTRRR